MMRGIATGCRRFALRSTVSTRSHRGVRGRQTSSGILLVAGLAVSAFLSPDAAAQAVGRLQGSVVVGDQFKPRRVLFRTYEQLGPAVSPSVRQPDGRQLQNVVIYLESVPQSTPVTAPVGRPSIRQINERFEPHVLPVVTGTTVDFPNRDLVFHNVFSLSKAKTFDLARYPRGAVRSVRFDEPGVVKVFCHIHSDMSAVVLVLDNPFFTVAGPDGTFSLEGIPPGEHTVVGWHERARPVTRRVRIEPGRTSVVDFAFPVAEIAASGG